MSSVTVYHQSFSQLNTMRKCAMQLKLEKAGFPQPPAVWFVAGSAYHSATEDFDRHVWEHGKFAVDDDAMAFISQRWRHHFGIEVDEAAAVEPDMSKWRTSGRATKEKPNREDCVWWQQEGESMATAYARYMQDSPWSVWTTPEGVPALELELWFTFEVKDPATGETDIVKVRNFIDAIMVTPQGALVVRDKKTGKQPDDATQLGTYATAVEQHYGVRPAFGDYFLARKGGPSLPEPLGKWTYDALHSEYSKAHLMRKYHLYLSSPSGLCNSCGVARACPAQGGDQAAEWLDVIPLYGKKLDSEEAASE